MRTLVFLKNNSGILWRHFKFYLSRCIGYPLVSPDMLQLCFLYRCNLKCRMCSIQEKYERLKGTGQNYELSLKTIKNLIGQAAEMRIKQVFLLGGEPFLREDIFDIIKFAHNYQMKALVFTNGTLLGNPGIIDKILDSNLDDLMVSIDGACENTYKNIRAEGILGKIRTNIQLLNRAKKEKGLSLPNLGIFCTIMDQNIEELIDVVYLARELGVDCVRFQPVVVDNTDARLRDNSDSNWVPESRYDILDKSIDKLIEYKSLSRDNFRFVLPGINQLRLIKQYFRSALGRQKCYMGFNRIIISQDGKMYFCAAEPDKGQISFGDIHQDRLKDLWYSRNAQIFRKSVKECAKPCLLGTTRRGEFDSFMDTLYCDYLRTRN